VTAIRHESEFYFNGFIQDISIRKQREEELVQMKEKAEQAAKAKSQFLSVMSHELRTPLNAVIGSRTCCSRATPVKNQQEDLRTLQFSGESLLNIINDILDFTKLDSGRSNYPPSTSTCVNLVRASISPSATGRRKSISYSMSNMMKKCRSWSRGIASGCPRY